MTVCLVASLSGIVVAVADTRIGLTVDDDRLINHDGPGDLQVNLPQPHGTVVMPYKYRKLRYLGGGWATVAGEIANASLVLDALRQASAQRGTDAAAHLNAMRADLEDRAHLKTGVAREQLRQTVVFGAPLGTPNAAWRIGLAPVDTRTNLGPKWYVANFPGNLPDGLSESVIKRFEIDLLSAIAAQDQAGLVRACARVVAAISPHSSQVSARAQIGVTIADPRGGHVARYFDAEAERLSMLQAAEFLATSEAAG